jgi:hypothetical protein
VSTPASTKPGGYSDDDVVTPPIAAEIAGLSLSMMNKMRVTGSGPTFLRLSPRAVRYRVGDIRSWLASKRVSSTSEYAPDLSLK